MLAFIHSDPVKSIPVRETPHGPATGLSRLSQL